MEPKLKIFSLLAKNKENKKQLWVIVIIGAILLLAWPAGTEKKESPADSTETKGQEYVSRLEKRLEETLEKVEGAGQVTVLLTPKSFGKISVAKDTSSSHSDTAESTEETIVLCDDIPVILEEYYPTIGGAVIVAEGAKTETIKTDLKRAASAALQIGINRIEVLEGSQKR